MPENPYQAPKESNVATATTLVERRDLWQRRFWFSIKLAVIGLVLAIIPQYVLEFLSERVRTTVEVFAFSLLAGTAIVMALTALVGVIAAIMGITLFVASGISWAVLNWRIRRQDSSTTAGKNDLLRESAPR